MCLYFLYKNKICCPKGSVSRPPNPLPPCEGDEIDEYDELKERIANYDYEAQYELEELGCTAPYNASQQAKFFYIYNDADKCVEGTKCVKGNTCSVQGNRHF